MKQSISRMGSAIVELLLPTARARACTDYWCQQSGSRSRCCHICISGQVQCGAWRTGGCNCP
jgi:hypothetical protein